MENNLPNVSLEHLRQAAYNAHQNTSFSPEKRAETIIKEYTHELQNDLQHILTNVSVYNSAENTQETLTKYQEKYEKHLSAWLYSQSNVASSMITGPANFPVARMEKYRKWADNKYEYFREWRQRALKAIHKSTKPKINELEQARQKLKDREEMQQFMVSANKILRKGGPEVFHRLKELGLNEQTIGELMIPNWAGKVGFRPYQLSNNNTEIRRLRTRVTTLAAKDELARTQGEKIEKINGVKMVHNYETDRVQLHFEEKPKQEIILQLKSYGFRWTPSQRAWQRKLTGNAIKDAQNIVKGIKR